MARRIRIAVSVFFGLLTVALCVLWARSYWRLDFAEWSSEFRNYGLYSNRGEICIQRSEFFAVPSSFHSGSLPPRPDGLAPNPFHAVLGLTWSDVDRMQHFSIAYGWFVTFTVVAVAATQYRPRQFSLRTLLIATTVVAMVLELVVWIVR